MEALEEVVVEEVSQQIVKGKRTKRQRPSSPTSFTFSNAHGEGVGGYMNNNVENTNETNNSSNNLRLSLGGSSDDDSTNTEDEEVARLLILLSQGNNNNPTTKFTSKKYIDDTNGKSAGMFVYECKTCNRTFSSFQALGGHRASHGKPKNLTTIEEFKKPRHVFKDDYDYDYFARNNNYYSMMNKSSTTSPKIHECSYCGAEFTSGQALGGHMRRHKGSNGNNNSTYNYYYKINNNTQPLLPLSQSLTTTPLSIDQYLPPVNKQKIINHNDDLSLSLSLDLNLPVTPPAQNDQKKQESHDVFDEYVIEKTSSPSPQKQNEQQSDDKNVLCFLPHPH